MLAPHPRREIAHLSVVAVVRQQQFWPDEEDLAVQGEHAAVEAQVSVQDRKANVQQDAMASVVAEDPFQHLERVPVDIRFEKVIQTSISRDLKLRPDTKACSSSLGLMDRLDDPVCVSFLFGIFVSDRVGSIEVATSFLLAYPVQRPLIEITGRDDDEPRHIEMQCSVEGFFVGIRKARDPAVEEVRENGFYSTPK